MNTNVPLGKISKETSAVLKKSAKTYQEQSEYSNSSSSRGSSRKYTIAVSGLAAVAAAAATTIYITS
jgi:hypothetical protein